MHTPYKLTTLDDVRETLTKGKDLSFDVETAFKDGFYSKVCLAQFYQIGMEEALLVQFPDLFELMLLLNEYHFYGHQIHYDITSIQQQSSTKWVPPSFDCTLYLSRLHYFKGDKFSADAVMEYAMGYCPYDAQGLVKTTMQKSNYDVNVLSDAQCRYAACDVYNLVPVYEAAKMQKDTTGYQLDISFLRACLDFQWNGMPVVNDKLLMRYEQNLLDMDAMGLGELNVNSYQQVRIALGGVAESDELALRKLEVHDGNKLAGDICDKRKIIKQNSFLNKFDAMCGRIFGKFKPGARSGRSTSDDQNLQQIPRKLKGIFGTKKGRVLVYSDYAQIELRTICATTACRAMEKLFRAGKDLHAFTADFLFGVLNKENRQISKTCNFNFLYAGGVPVFISILLMQARLIMKDSKASGLRDKWRVLWPEIYAWQLAGIKKWRSGKHGSTALGRRYKARRVTDFLNIENQGNAADVAKLATHYMKPKLDAIPDTIICDFIHDAWIVECDDNPEIYEEVAVIIADCMQRAWFEMSRLFVIKDLPMPVQVIVGTNWGDIEDDDKPNIYEYNLEGMATYATI